VLVLEPLCRCEPATWTASCNGAQRVVCVEVFGDNSLKATVITVSCRTSSHRTTRVLVHTSSSKVTHWLGCLCKDVVVGIVQNRLGCLNAGRGETECEVFTCPGSAALPTYALKIRLRHRQIEVIDTQTVSC